MHTLLSPLSIAGLPASSAWVWVAPPLFANGPKFGSPERKGLQVLSSIRLLLLVVIVLFVIVQSAPPVLLAIMVLARMTVLLFALSPLVFPVKVLLRIATGVN